jgi:hypothetical protein
MSATVTLSDAQPYRLQDIPGGNPGSRDRTNQVHLGYLGGSGAQKVLGGLELAVGADQVLSHPLRGLSVVILRYRSVLGSSEHPPPPTR